MLTGALNRYEYEHLRDSMLAAIPKVGASLGEGKSHGVQHARAESARSVAPPLAESSSEDDGPSDSEGGGSDGSEFADQMRTVTAYETEAKRRRGDVTKARGYLRKAQDPAARADRIRRLKLKLPCMKCGQLGHWARECPKKDVLMCGTCDESDGEATTVPEVYIAGTKVRHLMLVDTACARSVAGDDWYLSYTEAMSELGWPVPTVAEAQPFKFGPGEKILSAKVILVAIPIKTGCVVYVRVSIIDRPLPCLLSQPALRALKGNISFATMKMTFQTIEDAPGLNLVDTSGHVGIRVGVEKPMPMATAKELRQALQKPGTLVIMCENYTVSSLESNYTVVTATDVNHHRYIGASYSHDHPQYELAWRRCLRGHPDHWTSGGGPKGSITITMN